MKQIPSIKSDSNDIQPIEFLITLLLIILLILIVELNCRIHFQKLFNILRLYIFWIRGRVN